MMTRRSLVLTAVFAILALSACGGGGGGGGGGGTSDSGGDSSAGGSGGGSGTLSVEYSQSAFALAKDVAVTISPKNVSSSVTCTISPALPPGLQIHSGDCVISGTPANQSPDTGYTVKVEAGTNSSTTTINIAVGVLPAKTNQDGCWNSAGNYMYCNSSGASGHDGAVQSGHAIEFTRPTRYQLTTQYTTVDNATGLVWTTCSQGLNYNAATGRCDTGSRFTGYWPNANEACGSLNSGTGYAGRTDWRMPAIEELQTLLNFGAASPLTFSQAFPDTSGSSYWSATTNVVAGGASVWRVEFADGTSSYGTKTGLQLPVHCVSGVSSLPKHAFADNGDGTVRDMGTGLIWQKCSVGQNPIDCSNPAITRTWSQAFNDCAGLSLGAVNRTWRLPNVNELNSLVDRSRHPAIDTGVFPGISATSEYWSSTNGDAPPKAAYTINISDGGAGSPDGVVALVLSAASSARNVRCVATGP
jgi:hypothetical protein